MSDTNKLHVKGSSCPCGACEGAPLLLICCPKCRVIVGVCEEVGTIFVDPRVPDPNSYLSWLDFEGDRCVACNESKYCEFGTATANDVKIAGFSSDELE